MRLYFVLIVAKWKMAVQLSSGSLSMAGNNSLVYELRFVTDIIAFAELYFNATIYAHHPILK